MARRRTIRVRDPHPTDQVVDYAYDDSAEHIAANGPDIVLAEVDAKLRVIEQAEDYRRAIEHGGAGVCTRYFVEEMQKVLRLLALPYATHPDYREEWRP